MAPLTPILVVLWIPIGVYAFARYPRPVAVLLVAIAGTLFLPEIQWAPTQPDAPRPVRLPMLELTKFNSISYALLIGWLMFDGGRLGHVRWSLADAPALALAVVPAVSSAVNGLSANDVFFELRAAVLGWGVPYLIARVYLGGADGCRTAIVALALGGIVYIPFCLFEIRLSPVLHYKVFGFQQHSFLQTIRLGGYRPMVFMQHGLAVGIFMASATVALFWLWWSRLWPTLHLPDWLRNWPGLWLAVLAGTTLLCKSFGALALGIGAAVALVAGDRFRISLAVWALLAVPPAYVLTRTTGSVPAQRIVELIGGQVNAERTESFEYRVINEDKFMAAMGNNVLFGMGGGGRAHPKDHIGRPIIADGLWIIQYFNAGAAGLAALIGYFLLPVLRFLLLCPGPTWSHPQVAPAAVAAVISAILMIDCLLNSMLNPFLVMLPAVLNGWCDWAADEAAATAGSHP
jgi:hypothetical protein